MENNSSSLQPAGQNPSSPPPPPPPTPPPVDQEHVLLSFGTLCLTRDGVLHTGLINTSNNNNDNNTATKPESRKAEEFKNQWPPLTTTTTLEQVSANAICRNTDQRFFNAAAGNQSSVSDAQDNPQEPDKSSIADKEWYKQILAIGKSRNDSALYFPSSASSSSLPYHGTTIGSSSNDGFTGYGQSGLTDSAVYNYYQDNGLYHHDDAIMFNPYQQRNHQQDDSWDLGRPPNPLEQLTNVMIFGTYEQKKGLLSLLLQNEGSIITVMTDVAMHSFFLVLLDQCEGLLFDSLVRGILSRPRMFVNAAFLKQGARSILKLVKKVKKTDHAFTVATILSTRFFDLMTHPVAKTVIQHCLILFRCDANQVLYESAIYHCQELATHKVGCRSINDLINTINAGPQRLTLLNRIAIASTSLAHDPYGNYVVQNVLDHKDYHATRTILLHLRSQFIELAKKKEGSHVVEKCMACSSSALVFVVEEILTSPGTAYQLAQHPFGNYVIQRALKMTKALGDSGPYMLLVGALEPYAESLKKSAGGKTVLNLLKDL